MSLEGARRVMETSSYDTANQYLRFGWKLINQHVVEATADTPRHMTYVLASVSSLEDTKELTLLTDVDEVNAHLKLGWKLIQKYIAAAVPGQARNESISFVVAWQSDDPPAYPGISAETEQGSDYELGDIVADT